MGPRRRHRGLQVARDVRGLAALGVAAEPVIYAEDRIEAVRELLLALDGVLVWVNPLEQGRDRSLLDPLLREIGDAGAFVSTHPDMILKMGTKDVLVKTRDMSCGTDSRIAQLESAWVAEMQELLGVDTLSRCQ